MKSRISSGINPLNSPRNCFALVRGDPKAHQIHLFAPYLRARCNRAVHLGGASSMSGPRGCIALRSFGSGTRVAAKNLSHTILRWVTLSPMNPPAAFLFLIATAQSLVAAVTTRDNLHLRPALARKAVAARLKSGMIVLRAFLRRLIILMALDLEWRLVETRGVMKRPHGRKSKSTFSLSLSAFDTPKASPWLDGTGPQSKRVLKTENAHWHNAPVELDMSKLYAQLDFLAKIAANPTAKVSVIVKLVLVSIICPLTEEHWRGLRACAGWQQ